LTYLKRRQAINIPPDQQLIKHANTTEQMANSSTANTKTQS